MAFLPGGKWTNQISVDTISHVGDTGCEPHTRASRQADHRVRFSSTRRRGVGGNAALQTDPRFRQVDFDVPLGADGGSDDGLERGVGADADWQE